MAKGIDMATRLQCGNVFAKCRFSLLLVSASAGGLLGCSGSDNTPSSENGGTGVVGGATGAGDTGGRSAANGTGGANATGGAVATGGVVATGGAVNATGGMNATGGAVNATGGKAATGGAVNATGGMNAGGANATGGMNAGGANTTGGKAATGGVNAGGANATGGKAATGGMNAGGATATGGKAATGGTNAGGANATGGATTAGGTSGSPGCGKAITRPNPSTQQTMDVQGTARTYLLDVPTSADNQTALPLIFALHGANMTNSSVVGSFNFDTRSGGKVITVYPQGDDTSSGQRWTSNATNWTYIQNLMTDLESRYCIDTGKVFLTGFSMGGGFTMDTACQHPDWFRAFATVEGYGPGGVSAATSPTCTNATTKAAMLIIQGSTDTTVTPAMGQASLAFWTAKNGCSSTTTTPTGTGFTSCTAYETCTSNLPVYYCTGTWTHTITTTAAADVWAFFSSFK